jgi:predicted GNAT superfamily acetyltransferase
VSIRQLHGVDDLAAVVELFVDIWAARAMDPPVNSDLLRALAHVDAYVAGAYAGGRIVGAGVGFYGPPSTRMLHSHIVGVDPQAQARSIGYAIKVDQRAWALERGVRSVTWTFDPLVRRNAYFNVAKLGARAASYLVDFYGEMRDGINAGQGSDRLLVVWDLTTPLRPGPASAELPAGAQVWLDEDESGAPVRRDATASVRACRVPADIAALRARDPETARAWRHAVRDTMGAAVMAGAEVTSVTRSGWYVIAARSEA